jgi:hypothetical protein
VQGEAAHPRHAHIRNQNIRFVVTNCVQQVFRALEAARLYLRLFERFLKHPAHRLIVVDYPDL